MNAFEEINERNRIFWEAQTDLLLARISDAVLYELAVEEMDSEQRRGVPIYCRKTLETALETAELVKPRLFEQFCHERARDAGSAPKADALTKLVQEIHAKNPSITAPEVLQRLREHHDFTVDEENIYYPASNGREKSVPITALKDRLSRIRKGTNSR
jgi:hypothetical protein